MRDYQRKWKYGLLLGRYDKLLLGQDGLCAACNGEEIARRRDGSIKPLTVDHDHLTGEIRGLLCNGCNAALGMLKDNPMRVARLLAYITRESPDIHSPEEIESIARNPAITAKEDG